VEPNFKLIFEWMEVELKHASWDKMRHF